MQVSFTKTEVSWPKACRRKVNVRSHFYAVFSFPNFFWYKFHVDGIVMHSFISTNINPLGAEHCVLQ